MDLLLMCESMQVRHKMLVFRWDYVWGFAFAFGLTLTSTMSAACCTCIAISATARVTWFQVFNNITCNLFDWREMVIGHRTLEQHNTIRTCVIVIRFNDYDDNKWLTTARSKCCCYSSVTSLLLTSHAVQDLAHSCGYCKLLPYAG